MGRAIFQSDFRYFISDDGDVFLASCAQDCFIRIWRISERNPDEVTSMISVQDLSLEEDIRLQENTFSVHCAGACRWCRCRCRRHAWSF